MTAIQRKANSQAIIQECSTRPGCSEPATRLEPDHARDHRDGRGATVQKNVDYRSFATRNKRLAQLVKSSECETYGHGDQRRTPGAKPEPATGTMQRAKYEQSQRGVLDNMPCLGE